VANRPDDELILFFYGEHASPAEIEDEMSRDPELKRRYERLASELRALSALDAPEPRPGLEGRIWARVAPELSSRRGGVPWLRFATLATAVGAVALGAFLAGRHLQPPPSETEVAATIRALPTEARDRVLAATLADHLASSERLLLEVENGHGSLEEEQRFAEALLGANRLYRRAAERAGQRRVAAVLAEIEPILAQLANAPAEDRGAAQEQIAGRDLLFKVRVTRSNLKEIS
jgi:hypothetical protein